MVDDGPCFIKSYMIDRFEIAKTLVSTSMIFQIFKLSVRTS